MPQQILIYCRFIFVRLIMIQIVLLLLGILPFAVQGSSYNVVARREAGTPQPPSASPQLISFDGDLDYIIEQALKRAVENGDTPAISDAPSSSPDAAASPSLPVKPSDSIVLNAYKCDKATIGHLEILTFQYSIETALGANVSVVIGEVEEILLESIGPNILACRNDTVKSAGIVALDSLVPADTTSKTGKIYFSLQNHFSKVNNLMVNLLFQRKMFTSFEPTPHMHSR